MKNTTATRRQMDQAHRLSQKLESLRRNRQRMRQILSDYKEWHDRIEHANEDQERMYLNYEGTFLQSHMKEGWSLYKDTSKDYYTILKGAPLQKAKEKA